MTALLAGTALAPAYAQGGDFQACLQNIKADALRQGVPAEIADRAFQGLTPDQKVIDLDSRQPEFSLTYAKYVGSSVSAERIAKGQQKMAQNRALLDAMQSEYGVPPQYIMAFWGLETNYGGYMGDFQVVRSVATLGCMTKRTAFFSNETVQALRILVAGPHDPRAVARLVGRRHGQHAVHALDLHEMGRRSRRQRQDRPVDQPARFLRLGGQLPARRRLQARPAVERGSVPAAGLPARPGRHHDRKAGARLGGDGRQASRQRSRCPMSTIPRRSSCRPAGADPPSSSIPTSRR